MPHTPEHPRRPAWARLVPATPYGRQTLLGVVLAVAVALLAVASSPLAVR